jgi:hypothetical protein
MSAKKIHPLEAERALHRLDIQIEQYRVHLEELAAHPQEAEKARAVLERMMRDRAWRSRAATPETNGAGHTTVGSSILDASAFPYSR